VLLLVKMVLSACRQAAVEGKLDLSKRSDEQLLKLYFEKEQAEKED
jgi:hypothetical protein